MPAGNIDDLVTPVARRTVDRKTRRDQAGDRYDALQSPMHPPLLAPLRRIFPSPDGGSAAHRGVARRFRTVAICATVVVVAGVVCTVGACRPPEGSRLPANTAAPSAPPAAPPPGALFLPGERIEWEVSWFDVFIGRIDWSVGEPGVIDGRQVVLVRSEGHSDGAAAIVKEVHGEAVTAIDTESGLPLAQGGTFDVLCSGQVVHGGTYGSLGMRPWDSSLALGRGAHNLHTALGRLRAWMPEPGERTTAYLHCNRTVAMHAVAAGDEKITTPRGVIDTERIEGVAIFVGGSDLSPLPNEKTIPYAVWVSADEHRVPVRMHIWAEWGGIVKLEATAYQPPTAKLAGS
jgi:hypothetical protein